MQVLEGMKVRKAGEIKFLTEEYLSNPTDVVQKRLTKALELYLTIEKSIVDWNESHARLFPNGTPSEQLKRKQEASEKIMTT